MKEEFESFEEQPSLETSTEIAVEDKQDGSSNTAQDVEMPEKAEAERGVPVGKFNSVEELLTAYNNLEAEFTRKSQKLAEVLKDKTIEQSPEEKLDTGLHAFLSKNEEAFCYAQELKDRVQNENLAGEENCFEKAWAGLLYEKLVGPNKAKEPLVQNLILKDDDLQNLVIKNYMKQLQEQKTPIVITSNSGERVTKPVTPKPETFEDAKKVALDMFS